MAQASFDFSGRTVAITGGSSGIGRATALAFGAAGATVVIGSRERGTGDAVAEEVTRLGGRGLHFILDVSDDEEVKKFVDTAVEQSGRLDIAFNNAGTLPPTGALLEQSRQDWDRTIAVDLTGAFFSLRHEVRAMLASGGGSIINTASVAGVIADPGMAPYAAAKHGVIGLTRAVALDYADQGIRVNAIAPGLVRTPMIEGWLNDPTMRSTVLSYSPQGRISEPEEIAGLVLFLASDLSPFVNGAVYLIDGGQTAH